jgi:hypothetical protein
MGLRGVLGALSCKWVCTPLALEASPTPASPMVTEETFKQLLPLACAWAKAQETFILARGIPLDPRYRADACLAGVKDVTRIRVLIVEKIPLPPEYDLAEAARHHQIITDASRGIAIGYGIVIRADGWGDRELIVHQLVHVAQSERFDTVERYIEHYLSDRYTCARFTNGSFEEEARRLSQAICGGDAAMLREGAA